MARTGSTDGHRIHVSVASIHPDRTAGCGRCWEGKATAVPNPLTLQATPLWAGVPQCLLVITLHTQGGDSTDGLGRVQKTGLRERTPS